MLQKNNKWAYPKRWQLYSTSIQILTVKQKEALILSKGMRSVNDKMVYCIEIKAFYAIININADVVESAVCNPTKKTLGL